ncbi:MAG: trigger factor [Lachnospiraceae bacterium]|nr:trigger factor [Lachnospiraceae bacterium]
MSIQVEKLEHNMAKLTIEVSAEDFDAAVNKAYLKNKNKISVPGFRKGKVPRQMVEKMYGKGVFYEDAANIIIPEAYDKAFDECEEEIVSAPEIDVTQLEAGKPFIFTATVAIKPEVTLGAYKGVEVEKIDTEVSDAELEEAIQKELEQQSRMVAVEGRPVQDGDQISLDFDGSVDGVPFDGGKSENYSLTIGSGAFIPGFEEQLIGKNAGDECDVNVTFPEDYHAEELAGKAAVFKCKIHEIKEKQIPALDEDFIDDAGEFDSVDAYKADLKQKLTDTKVKNAEKEKQEKVLDAIIEAATMDVPAAMVDTECKAQVNQFAQQLSMQGMNIEQYFMFTGLTKEKMAEQVRPRAEKKIKSTLVLEAIAKAENMEASEEEIDKEIADMAKEFNMDNLKDTLREEDKKNLAKDIVIKKALDFVTENAKEK